ncbi:MAG: bifunctional riboflavin kinase/FAD synthetase [Caldimicrobium sp.]
MKIFSLKNLPLPFETAVTIGAFDGIHLGHKALIQETIKVAQNLGIKPTLLTFHPHPRLVLQPHLHMKLLTTLEEKIELIKKEGIENLVILPFTKTLAELSPELFVEKYLVDLLKTQAIIVGFNFQFGRGRSGNIDLLNKLGEKYGFSLKVLSPIKIEDKTVSSTLIRELLQKGEVAKASIYLGRPYTLRGTVIKGKGRGKLLGFPTANLYVPEEKLIPAQGVYAVWAFLNGTKYQGALNIGFNPTFDEKNLSIEVHLLNYNSNQELYNKRIELHFVERIRAEKKFTSVEELKAQIQKDCLLIKNILS